MKKYIGWLVIPPFSDKIGFLLNVYEFLKNLVTRTILIELSNLWSLSYAKFCRLNYVVEFRWNRFDFPTKNNNMMGVRTSEIYGSISILYYSYYIAVVYVQAMKFANKLILRFGHSENGILRLKSFSYYERIPE